MKQARNDKARADSQPTNGPISGMVLGMSVGMSLGGAFGVVIGLLLEQSWLWLSMGASVGLGVGLCLEAVRGRSDKNAMVVHSNNESTPQAGVETTPGDYT